MLAVVFGEREAEAVEAALTRFDALYAANLLEAELAAALRREGLEADPTLADAFAWVLPERPLGPEIARAAEAGYLRGADLWHVATALYLAERPADLAFLTLDARQARVAASLGFRLPLEPADGSA